MKEVMLALVVLLLASVVVAQEAQYTSTFEQKMTAYEEAQANWEMYKSTFRTTRPRADHESFIAAQELNNAMAEQMVAHMRLVKSAMDEKEVFPRKSNFEREINIKINELEEMITQNSDADSKTDLVRNAGTLRRLWSESKAEIIKPIAISLAVAKTDSLSDRLNIVIAKLKDQQGTLKTEGVNTVTLDEAIQKIERNQRQISENVNIAEKRMEDAARLGLDSDHIFQEAIDRLREASDLGKESIDLIRDIQNSRDKYVGGALE